MCSRIKHKANAGFSLVEVLVAITVLALLSIPVSSSLILAARMNAKSSALLQAQLDVSNAAEVLMSEGIKQDKIDDSDPQTFNGTEYGTYDTGETTVTVQVETGNNSARDVIITSKQDDSVSITTTIHCDYYEGTTP